MSVLYPLTLRRNYTRSRPGKANSAIKFVLFFLIASISFNGLFAQEVSKEEQARKEAELKKQEAEQTDAKLKANPRLRERLEAIGQLKPLTLAPASAEPQKISDQQLAEEKARYMAKHALEKTVVQNGGVEYKVITNGNQVEYVVTNAGNVIYRQQINSSASLYDRQVRAEKEGLYASNTFRRNLNYPHDALQSEIRSLINAPKETNTSRVNNDQRVAADYTFNGGGGTIPASGAATPYPAVITVSGVPAGALVKEIKITGLNHTWSDDVDIVLQSPSGTNVILMSDVGGSSAMTNRDYTWNDGAATNMGTTTNPSGTYKPTNFVGTLGVEPDNWVAPGPGVLPQPNPTLSSFGNGIQNGDWKLFVLDDASPDGGNWGSWSITFTDPPVVCFPISLTGQPSDLIVCAGTNGSFTVTATPNGVSYNWQVNTGSGFVYLTNGGVYSGVTTATLNITGATLAMNGYQYRCVVTCSGGGLPEISNPATLTVNVSPSPPGLNPTAASICPGGSVALNTTASTIISSGSINVAIPDNSATGATHTINVSGFPALPVASISVTFNITHTWDGDLDINLVAPNGNILNLVNNRGSNGVNFVNTVISSAAVTPIASGAAPFTGTYLPDGAAAQGPTGFVSNVTLFSDLFSVPNGNWTLAISDGAGGDIGTLTSWSINITPIGGVPPPAMWTPVTGLFNDAGLTSPYVAGTNQTTVYASPATTTTYSASVTNGTCNSPASTVTVTVNAAPVITAQPGNANACVGVTKTLSVTATGAALTYQWQVDMGSGFVNITTGTPTNPGAFLYTGQTTATLSINAVMATMNGYKYRVVVVSGSCTATTSTDVTLAVNQRPGISVTSSAQCSPTTLTASGANTYSWSPSAGLSATTGATVTANPAANTIYTITGTNTTTGCTNTTQVDVKFTPPTPVIAPAAPIICAGTVQQLSITSSSLPPVAATASSGTINLGIPDNEFINGVVSAPLVVSGVTGSVQSISVNFNITHSWDADLDINLIAPNGNILNLVGARGGSGDNFTNTTISSASATSLATGTPPFSGTFAADGNIGWGPANSASNVATFASLFSVPNGNWRLAMADFAGGDVGTLVSWSVTVNYATPDAGIWTPVTGLFTNSAGTTPYVAGTAAATVYASPAATTTYSVTISNSGTQTGTFSTGGSVTIPGVAPGSTVSGAGDPYPSTLAVAGIPANAVIRSVNLKGIKHTWSSDIDILLQSPTGTNVVLMSDVGGSGILNNFNYTFDDAGGAMSTSGANGTGTYHPTNNGPSDTYPAPVGAVNQASPALSMFTGDPNGTWNLYVADGAGGDIGYLTSWEIKFTLPAITCTSAPRTVTVTVQAPIVYTTQPANRTACQNGSVTFTAAATGTITTTQWQVSTNGGTTWTDISGANTTTLTLTNVQPSQNGYRYRLALSNAGCGAVNSNAATLTVNPLPTVSLNLSPAGQTQLSPGKQTIVTVSSSPAGASYQWFINGVAEPSITGSSYAVDAHHLGTYTVRVTDVNGCVSTTSGVTFTALPTFQLFVFPNPTSGAFYVTYFMPQANTRVTLVVIDMMGRRMIERHEVTTSPYTRFDFSNSKLAAGVYIIEFRNSGGQRLAAGQLVVTR